MKKLYNKFFGVIKEGKVCEKALFSYIAATVVLIVVCLTAMSLTAYAYFTSGVHSNTNQIMAANYDLDIEIVKMIDETTTEKVLPKEPEGMSYTLSEGAYMITMTPNAQTTASTGYCGIKLNDVATIYTKQIGYDQNGNPESFCFTFENIQAVSEVTFVPNWGTCVLNIPTATGTASIQDESRVLAYEVVTGDTLFKIANTYTVDVTDLATFNDIRDPELIDIGQIIYIPITNEKQ